jgi:peptidoglycan/LPS O-acetylase OafA/YrhL
MPRALPTTRLDALDGWRAIAVLLVILQHVARGALRSQNPVATAIFGEFGELGVNVFFVISGYVICTALCHEYGNHGRISLMAFYIRRCFRIMPPFWCYLAVITVLSYAGWVVTPDVLVLKAAAFVCNLPIAEGSNWYAAHTCSSWHVAHTWSLAYEEQFYILFPITFLLISPRRRNIFLGAFFMLPLVIVFCYLRRESFMGDYLTRFQFLLTGVVTALFSDEIKPYLRKLRPVVIYLFVVAIFAVHRLPYSAPITLLRILVQGPLIGIVLFYTSHFPCAAKDILSYPAMRFTGRISYGIYLWQQLATGYYEGAGVLFYVIALSLMAVVCVASFFWIEQPLIRFAGRLSKARIARESGSRVLQTNEP